MGAHVYLTAAEIEAVHDACGRLSAMLEASSGEDKTLQASIDSLYGVIDKNRTENHEKLVIQTGDGSG